jgi:hypothetical protein
VVTEDTIGLLGETSLTNPDLKVLQLSPGYYPGGINLSSGSWTSDEVIGYTPNPDPNLPDIPIYKVYDVELRLNRGASVEDSLYALGGSTDGQSGLIIKGNANLYGEFVTLYVTGAHNGYDNVKYGVLDIGGNGYVEVSPPGDFFLGADGMPQIDVIRPESLVRGTLTWKAHFTSRITTPRLAARVFKPATSSSQAALTCTVRECWASLMMGATLLKTSAHILSGRFAFASILDIGPCN